MLVLMVSVQKPQAHERTLHTDVLFGLVKDVARFRLPLVLLHLCHGLKYSIQILPRASHTLDFRMSSQFHEGQAANKPQDLPNWLTQLQFCTPCCHDTALPVSSMTKNCSLWDVTS